MTLGLPHVGQQHRSGHRVGLGRRDGDERLHRLRRARLDGVVVEIDPGGHDQADHQRPAAHPTRPPEDGSPLRRSGRGPAPAHPVAPVHRRPTGMPQRAGRAAAAAPGTGGSGGRSAGRGIPLRRATGVVGCSSSVIVVTCSLPRNPTTGTSPIGVGAVARAGHIGDAGTARAGLSDPAPAVRATALGCAGATGRAGRPTSSPQRWPTGTRRCGGGPRSWRRPIRW